ncbi:MAG: thiosulfate oxidation carrier protein SoxY [Aestuariivita sp.]|nr:thiosulfate oxidation carrier protein SoxY [Aestuariivita sp.]MCY4347330.1 thiosulfate oxidation carrier protein SoxY [Aestuariivita sp.]
MELTRRQTVVGGAAIAMLGLPRGAFAVNYPMVGTPDEFTQGAEVGVGNITLMTPEIAENGNNVPIQVAAPGAVEIRIFATENPEPAVASFAFGALAGSQAASTRVRLAKSQDVVAIAKLADGSFIGTSNNVKVTIGGCGG